jgi:hypothetical protein
VGIINGVDKREVAKVIYEYLSKASLSHEYVAIYIKLNNG